MSVDGKFSTRICTFNLIFKDMLKEEILALELGLSELYPKGRVRTQAKYGMAS